MYSSQQKISILKSLDNILKSEGFAQAPQLQNFLKFVVHKTLENKTSEIKGYTIGVDALGRNADFDPHTDPSVRVMAGRLRQSLKNYYSEKDKENSGNFLNPQIHMPKGSYVPVFKFDDNAAGQTVQNTPPAQYSPSNKLTKLLIFSAAALLIITLGLVYYRSIPENTNNPSLPIKTDVINLGTARISISLRANEDPVPQWFSSDEALAGLVTAFSRFKEFEIHQVPWDNTRIPLRTGTGNTLADYHFSVLITRAGISPDVRAFAKLTRQSDKAIIWSDLINIPKPSEPVGLDASRISGRNIAPLLSPYGVIYGDIINRKQVPPRLECINRFYSYFAAETIDKYAKARNCLEQAIDSGTASSSLHAMLAFLYVENYRKQIPGYESDALSKADEVARKAITLNPKNARAHQAQFGIFKIRGHREQATAAALKAIELNPFDSDIIGDFAAYLVSIGEFEKAAPILDKAILLNASKPVWLEFYIFLLAEFTGKFEEADIVAERLNAELSPLAALAIVLSAQRNGNTIQAEKAYISLVRQEPDFAIEPGKALMRRGFDQQLVETISVTLDTVKSTLPTPAPMD
ncbi:MAG: hypothetical protein L3J32_10830 [Rhizobiaceae bacterium]|nr:hypothetical protein [Rhizobiaceae bacterium]